MKRSTLSFETGSYYGNNMVLKMCLFTLTHMKNINQVATSNAGPLPDSNH